MDKLSSISYQIFEVTVRDKDKTYSTLEWITGLGVLGIFLGLIVFAVALIAWAASASFALSVLKWAVTIFVISLIFTFIMAKAMSFRESNLYRDWTNRSTK